jgi:hypothetical protein
MEAVQFWLGLAPLAIGSVVLMAMILTVARQCRQNLSALPLTFAVVAAMLLSLTPIGIHLGLRYGGALAFLPQWLWLAGSIVAVPVAAITHHAVQRTQRLAEFGEDSLNALGEDDDEEDTTRLRLFDMAEQSLDRHLARLRTEAQAHEESAA